MDAMHMRAFYVSVWRDGRVIARHSIPALDETDAERELIHQYPQYAGLSIIVEGTWK